MEIIIFGIPLLIWLACAIAAYFRIHAYEPKTKNPTLRLIAIILHFLIIMFSGLVLYQSVIDYMNLSEHLSVLVAMVISLVSEGFAKAVIRLTNDYKTVKAFLLEIVRRVCGFKE